MTVCQPPDRTGPLTAAAAATLLCCGVAHGAAPLAAYYPGDIGQAVAAVAAFGLLLAILGRWAWKPVISQMHQREEDIAGASRRAEQTEQEANDLLAYYKARLGRAEADAQSLLAKTREEAGRIRDKALQDSQAETRRDAARGRQDIERAKQQAMIELREATARMASQIAGKVVGEELSQADQDRLLERCLQEIVKQAGQDA